MQSPIQTIFILGNDEVKKKAGLLQKNGVDVRPILYPTVPKGSERLRIILHAFNVIDELDLLLQELNKILTDVMKLKFWARQAFGTRWLLDVNQRDFNTTTTV